MKAAPQPQQAASRSVVLEHVGRYRMSVPPAIACLMNVKHLGRKRLRTLLAQMCGDGELARAPLYGNRPYYYLPEQAAADEQHPQRSHRAGPLSEPAKIHNYAILAYCCLHTSGRQRLTAAEVAQHFPQIARPRLPLNYYVDTAAGRPRLGFIRVDAGGHGRWDRVLARCRADLEAHFVHAGFRPFLQGGQFELALITALPQKAERLRQSIAQWRDAYARLIQVIALPDLLHLVAPLPPTSVRPAFARPGAKFRD
jgi:hypothetical protein